MTTKPNLTQKLREWIFDHYGVISWDEAIRLGATATHIRARLRYGDWIRIFTGVFRDGAVAKTPLQSLRAASLATRVGLVSHSSAAWLWDLLPTPPTRPELSVSREVGQARRPRGVTIHRSTDLDVSEGVLHKMILVTSPMRTLVDLAGTVAPHVLTNALDAALASGRVPLQAITGELDRLSQKGRPGVGQLRRELHDRGFIGSPAASVLEAKMLRIIIAAGLPSPAPELKVGDDGEYRLDFACPISS